MGWNVSNEKATIMKNDKGVYKTSIMKKDTDQETGEEIKSYMAIHVGFKKGVELKNKTKIKVNNGFITFFKIDVEEEEKPVYRYFPKLMIMDFEVLEDGIDENISSKPKRTTKTQSRTFDETEIDYMADDFSELPF